MSHKAERPDLISWLNRECLLAPPRPPLPSSCHVADLRAFLSTSDPVYANHLPFISFPSTWPIFTPAGKLANFLEFYVDTLELNVWCQSRVDPSRTRWNADTERWDVTIVRDGPLSGERTFSVQHIVLATGLGGGKPKMPAPFRGQESFSGKIVHSSGHGTAANWRGKRALVVGSCTSAHDICTDFANHQVDVTMLQRSPTFVMSVKNGMPMLGECEHVAREAHNS